jgi:hypothetical protein
MFRFGIALLILLLSVCGLAQGPDVMSAGEEDATVEEIAWSELPDSPGALLRLSKIQESRIQERTKQYLFPSTIDRLQSRAPASQSSETEPYHWKGLLLQSFAFDMLQNATRIITADQNAATVQYAALERWRQHQGELCRASHAGSDFRVYRGAKRPARTRAANFAQSTLLEQQISRVSMGGGLFDAIGDWANWRDSDLQFRRLHLSDRMQEKRRCLRGHGEVHE